MKRKKAAYGKNRRILRTVREAVPFGDRRARQAGDRLGRRHAGRHDGARYGRHLEGGEGLRLLPPHGRLHREDVRGRPHPGRLPQARGASFRQGHADGPHGGPSHPSRLRRRLQARGARRVHDARRRQHQPARHHLRHGRQRCPHAGRGSLRRPRRLRAHRPRRGDGRVHREPHVRGIRELGSIRASRCASAPSESLRASRNWASPSRL